MAFRRRWSREERLLAFRLYCRTAFGRLHARNPEIVALARVLGRTAGAVAMKACNFASFDPVQRARAIRGLSNASKADRTLWEEFEANSSAVAFEAEAAFERLMGSRRDDGASVEQKELPSGATEVERMIRIRRIQEFFRETVLAAYSGRCALTGLAKSALLNASHIIPWSVDERRRGDPRNGLCLNALHDRAFDRGLITFDERLRLVVSDRLRDEKAVEFERGVFEKMEGRSLALPERFAPDLDALSYHRECVFH